MTAAFTVILPHRRNPGNDAALRIAVQTLAENTCSDFILSIDAATDAPLYGRINRLVEDAHTAYCVYWASDVFAAPRWDLPMLELADEHTFVNGVLVEPGAIGVYPENLHKDFGRRPETFDRKGFELYCQDAETPGGVGWYCPYLFPRQGWLAHGGLQPSQYPDMHGFTTADVELFDRWRAAGNRVVRARSFAYHLQRWSEPAEQHDGKRG